MKICFLAPNVYPSLSKKYKIKKIGGAELQQIYIAKGLQSKGYEVSFITEDFGQPEAVSIDHLKIFKAYKSNEGISGCRFFYPRLYKIWKALIYADADVYYNRAAGFLPGILAIFCKLYKKKYIFAGALDNDFIPGKERIRLIRDKWFYHYGLKRASIILVQSARQKDLLCNNYGLESFIIPNFILAESKFLPNSDRKYILWVATIREWKRPMYFIRLAKAFPNEKFIMIGGSSAFEANLFNQVKKECQRLENLNFLGFLSFEETEKYFDQCKVFINTSLYEGFPNTLLQAWRRGIPVISFFDPDNIIKEKGLGFVPQSELELQEILRSFLSFSFNNTGRITKYFEENHSTGIVDLYDDLVMRLS